MLLPLYNVALPLGETLYLNYRVYLPAYTSVRCACAEALGDEARTLRLRLSEHIHRPSATYSASAGSGGPFSRLGLGVFALACLEVGSGLRAGVR